MSTKMTEAEDIMKRITDHKGVTQMIVMNKNGSPLYTSVEGSEANETQVKHIHELSIAARRTVRDMDPTDNLVFLRTSSDNYELLISPGHRMMGNPSMGSLKAGGYTSDEEFTVVVVQETAEKSPK